MQCNSLIKTHNNQGPTPQSAFVQTSSSLMTQPSPSSATWLQGKQSSSMGQHTKRTPPPSCHTRMLRPCAGSSTWACHNWDPVVSLSFHQFCPQDTKTHQEQPKPLPQPSPEPPLYLMVTRAPQELSDRGTAARSRAVSPVWCGVFLAPSRK